MHNSTPANKACSGRVGSLRGSQAFSWLRAFSCSRAESRPAHQRLTQIVSQPFEIASTNLDMTTAAELLQKALQDVCDAFNRKEFQPLLEADVAAYLYHRLLENGCPLLNLYSESRICGLPRGKRKFDIVIGTVNTSSACINPLLVAQLKCFQRWGHSPRQHQRRFEGVISGDIESLKELASILQEGRFEIIVDLALTARTVGYLNGTWNGRRRRDVLIDLCKDNAISLIWLHPNQQDLLEAEKLV